MITEAVVSELYTAILRYKQAIDRNGGISFEKERVKNLLFNYREEILDMMTNFKKADEEAEKDSSELEELREKVAVQGKMIETLTKKLNDRKKKDPAAEDKG